MERLDSYNHLLLDTLFLSLNSFHQDRPDAMDFSMLSYLGKIQMKWSMKNQGICKADF